mmetsp:Transcript_5496/g.16049  ORF Transcript_5496/g.16049 Transcript_5496/m.16049 type:complete len:270 (+) Transcript_5496:169-978(+)
MGLRMRGVGGRGRRLGVAPRRDVRVALGERGLLVAAHGGADGVDVRVHLDRGPDLRLRVGPPRHDGWGSAARRGRRVLESGLRVARGRRMLRLGPQVWLLARLLRRRRVGARPGHVVGAHRRRGDHTRRRLRPDRCELREVDLALEAVLADEIVVREGGLLLRGIDTEMVVAALAHARRAPGAQRVGGRLVHANVLARRLACVARGHLGLRRGLHLLGALGEVDAAGEVLLTHKLVVDARSLLLGHEVAEVVLLPLPVACAGPRLALLA